MAKQWFVVPDVVRLPLSDEQWIEVKRELTYGEEQALSASSLKADSAKLGEGLALDMENFQTNRLLAWLVDWSLRDGADRPVPVTADAIRALTTDAAKEIHAALDKHIAALEEEKKARNGKPAPGSTSS